MDSEALLKKILGKEKTSLPVAYQMYAGREEAYITYNEEDQRPALYADDQGDGEITWWTIHLWTPKNSPVKEYKKRIKEILISNGFTILNTENLYDTETKKMHIAISCWYGEQED